MGRAGGASWLADRAGVSPASRLFIRSENLRTTGMQRTKPQTTEGLVTVDWIPTSDVVEDCTYVFDWKVARAVNTMNHALHTYPAKFIPRIPAWALEYARLAPGARVLDPFSGSGTTLVEASVRGMKCIGYDVNPLARLLSLVKTTPLLDGNEQALRDAAEAFLESVRTEPTPVLHVAAADINLHENWKFWFDEPVMERLIAAKRAIQKFEWSKQTTELRNFFSVCLSVAVKGVSHFDESQIKVKKQDNKFDGEAPDVHETLSQVIHEAIPGMIEYAQAALRVKSGPATVKVDAKELDEADDSIDLIVTSPPYINAIDYPMAHKYSLFLLDLIMPADFKEHCLEYVGPTERAIKRHMSRESKILAVPRARREVFDEINQLIKQIRGAAGGSQVDQNRSFIVASYFSDVELILRQMLRVLKPGARAVIVLGDNRIRGVSIDTHDLVRRLGIAVGFEHELKFYHHIRGRKLGIKRNQTAGKIEREMVMVLRKPS